MNNDNSMMVSFIAGKDLGIVLSRNLYDPKYGIPKTLEDTSDEHMRVMVDFVADGQISTKAKIVAYM